MYGDGLGAMNARSQRPRRVGALAAKLPEGVTPSGSRGRILKAALKLFAEFGYFGSSIRNIAAGANINSATLYSHYPSKEHILAELIIAGHTELHRRLQQALVTAGPGPVAQLTALAQAFVTVQMHYPLLSFVAASELYALSVDQAKPALALRDQSQQLLLQVLRNGMDRGVFDIEDIWFVHTAIANLGVPVVTWSLSEHTFSPTEVADGYSRLVLRMAGVRQNSTRTEEG